MLVSDNETLANETIKFKTNMIDKNRTLIDRNKDENFLFSIWTTMMTCDKVENENGCINVLKLQRQYQENAKHFDTTAESLRITFIPEHDDTR
jgi:hypothetical protein